MLTEKHLSRDLSHQLEKFFSMFLLILLQEEKALSGSKVPKKT